jgi:hypothetical protein
MGWKETSMYRFLPEPTLDEALSDPLVRLVMEADGVDRDALQSCLMKIGRNLPALRKPAAQECAFC